MAPVIHKLYGCPWAKVTVIATAQHRELADEVLSLFDIEVDLDLDLMIAGQTLNQLSSRAITLLDTGFDRYAPDMVIAEGDTTSVMAAALACFHRQLPFLHVEAGLRTFDMAHPFPEEFNRIVASRVARLHFAPTEQARHNLLNEGVRDETIFVTGNTVIDALKMVSALDIELPVRIDPSRRLVLVTMHRRENFGRPILDICTAIVELVDRHKDIEVLWSVHPNPNVTTMVHERLRCRPRIHLVGPQPYGRFCEHDEACLSHSYGLRRCAGGGPNVGAACTDITYTYRATRGCCRRTGETDWD